MERILDSCAANQSAEARQNSVKTERVFISWAGAQRPQALPSPFWGPLDPFPRNSLCWEVAMGRLGCEEKPYTTLRSLTKIKRQASSSTRAHTYKINRHIKERPRPCLALHPSLSRQRPRGIEMPRRTPAAERVSVGPPLPNQGWQGRCGQGTREQINKHTEPSVLPETLEASGLRLGPRPLGTASLKVADPGMGRQVGKETQRQAMLTGSLGSQPPTNPGGNGQGA